MDNRYKVLPGSQSGHCCFDATVVDTNTPQKRWHGKEPRYEAVCECFDPADAELVAAALNSKSGESAEQKYMAAGRMVAGEDLHVAKAAEMFGVAKEAVTPDQRRYAKTATFPERFIGKHPALAADYTGLELRALAHGMEQLTPDDPRYHPPLMTAAEVNALPPKAREYIHQLVANADPAGMVRENMQLIDTNKGLQAMYRSAADDRDRMREVLERVKTGMEWTRDGVPAEQGWSRADDEMLAEIDNVLAGSKPTPQQKHIGYMVCSDGRYMYWPVEDLQAARTYCEDNVEPVKLMADEAELNKHEEGQV